MTKSRARQGGLVLFLCFAAYTCSYLCRTNLSVALPRLMQDIGFDKAAGGLLGSAYFWMYALGQLVSGALAEQLRPKLLVTAGLAGSALCNIAIVFSPSFWAIFALWGLNGFFLSMLWSAMVKILVAWFQGDEYRRASVVISLPTTVGYILSWGGLSFAISPLGWQAAFVIPAAITAAFLGIWMFFLREKPEEFFDNEQTKAGEEGAVAISNAAFFRMCLQLFFVAAAFVAVVQGVIKEGVNLWFPTILGETAPAFASAPYASAAVPALGALGILFTGWLMKKVRRSGDLLALLLLASLVLLLLLLALKGSAMWSLLLMGLLLASMSGMNILLTSMIPLKFLSVNRCAQASGLLNFMIYVGAAAGGAVSGWLSSVAGWGGLYAFWSTLCLIALLLGFSARKKIN